DRKKALRILTPNWLKSFRLPEELAFFGTESSELEPHSISESIWRAVVGGGVEGVRLYAGGDLENWDVSISRLRSLAFHLAGQDIKVEIYIPENTQQVLDTIYLYPLASLSEHPEISIKTITEFPRIGNGYLIAESIGPRTTRWAVGDPVSLEFNSEWGL